MFKEVWENPLIDEYESLVIKMENSRIISATQFVFIFILAS